MMYKSKICGITAKILILITCLTFSNNPATARELIKRENDVKNVLVIYDRRNYLGFKTDEVTAISHLFYHFNVAVDEIPASSYKSGMMHKYDRTVYVGISNENLSEILLDDMAKYKNPLLFIGIGIEAFIEHNPRNGIAFAGKDLKPIKVKYKGKEFILKTERLFQKVTAEDNAGKVVSSLSDGHTLYPYIIKISNLWYVSCLDTQGVLFYILADVLHDFFEEYHDENPQIYVRIEDVHAQTSVDNLCEIADYLNKEGIPYMVALIPAFYDVKTKNIYNMRDDKQFSYIIKYMQDSGGTILLHGYTHQIHEDIPGEGFEFWDGENDRPLDADMGKWVDERINAAINECTAIGIVPLAFEAPHYAISREGYKNLKMYFSTIVGHLQTSDKGYTTTVYPYRLYDSPLYNRLIPENLGYVDPEDVLYRQHILEELDKLSIVRDYTAGFYFHPHLDIDLLKDVISEIKKRDIRFLDLKQDDNWVKGENYIIRSQDGDIAIKEVKNRQESQLIPFFRKILLYLIILVLLICFRLLYIFLDRRRQSREHLFKE
ncbi:MAG: DUF2334 domain-containing protein [Tepidanaerobacter acetatoxydans]|uniref:polysaccharide deacetylase family protein n=1 Tax=Tepidanaerobacter acetatoxydans TaxID=499229 RepID=UPI0026F11631|nr:polysaccharide deacetylase family protein [Tepidanaerobacter acetatoxydans]NLU09355.1 DUF2334 domain-containing protein [Tepidanaerobacter acetatoxydans]